MRLSAAGLLLFVLSACAPETTCGISVANEGPRPDMWIVELAQNIGTSWHLYTCEALELRQPVVHTRPEKAWINPKTGAGVFGMTYCAFVNDRVRVEVEIGSTYEALIHELIHAAECPLLNLDHWEWPKSKEREANREFMEQLRE